MTAIENKHLAGESEAAPVAFSLGWHQPRRRVLLERSGPSHRGPQPPADPTAKGWLPAATPFPPPSSALRSLPDEAATVDTGHVLGKDVGWRPRRLPVTDQLGLTVSSQEGQEEHGTTTSAAGGDFCHDPCPHQNQHSSLGESPGA